MATDRSKYQAQIDKLTAQLIIDVEVIQASSALDLNIDEVKLIYAVVNSQKLYLEPAIGSSLYRKLQQSDLTFEYQLLIEKFLEDALISYAVAECITSIAFNLSNGGIYKHLPTDAESVSTKDISMLRQNYLSKGDTFMKRLMEFLNLNSIYYPEYKTSIGDGINANQKSLFTGGLLIEPSGGRQSYDDILIYGNGYCRGGVGSSDPNIFIAETYWGNSDESLITFDYTLLSGQSNVIPSYVTAQPVNSYFWVVSANNFNLSQAGIQIPTVPFDDLNVNTAIFVKGTFEGRTYIRIKVIEVYENPVTFLLVL